MNQAKRIQIRNGRVIDPASGYDQQTNIYIAGDRIVALDKAPDGFKADRTIDANQCIVCPGLIDLSVRLREPGLEHKASIRSESTAASAGGITPVCCPPDTNPVIDTPAVAELIEHRARQAGKVRVLPIGALTWQLAGEELSEMAALKAAGCIAVSNGLKSIASSLVARRAMEYAATHDLTVILHAEDPWLRENGCVHEGTVSCRTGMPGIPAAAETVAVARDIALIEQTGVHAHFGRLSTARAISMIAQARAEGLPVTADVSINHLFLIDEDVAGFNTQMHVVPPLRTRHDRDGLRQALADGTLDAITSDHQPHEEDAKEAPFPATEPGSSGLDTLLPLTLRLQQKLNLTLEQCLAKVTIAPARVLRLDSGRLTPGAIADICIFDPDKRWTVSAETMQSRGHNTPFMGEEMQGEVKWTLLAGKVVFDGQ